MGVIISHGACARMEERNVTNNLLDIFPVTKGGSKIDCEESPRPFPVTNDTNTEAFS